MSAEFELCASIAREHAAILREDRERDEAEARAEMTRSTLPSDVRAALENALEYFEDREDVEDGDYGCPRPNRAMLLAMEIRAVLAEHGEVA